MTQKQELLKEIKGLGYDDKFISWLRPRYTNKQLRYLIEDDKTFDIITSVAKQAGEERKS